MESRIRHILRSTAPRDSARIDLALIRAALILACSLALLTARLPTAPFLWGPGPTVLRVMSAFSLLFALVIASRLGSDSVGDVSTGLLGLIQLAGTRPWQWLVVRLVQMWVGFLSVWIVRAPAIAFMFTLGGVRLDAIVTTELALALTYLVFSGLALVISFGAQTRRHVAGRMVLVLFVWNMVLIMPAAIAASLSTYWPQYVPTVLVEALQWVASFSLSAQFALASSPMSTMSELWPGLVLYGGIAVALLLRFWYQVRATGTILIEERVRPQPGAIAGPPRASRRCWDDALAWQAFVFVGRGNRMVRIKAIGYALLAFLAWQSVVYGYEWVAILTLPVLCGGLLMNAINKSGECLTREINDKTIGTLLMTPHNYDELTAGWRRGSLRLAAPDLVLWGLMTIVSVLVHASAPPIMLCIAMVLVSSEHFFILSPLMPFSVEGISSGLALIFLFIALATACGIAGTLIHPWVAPLVLAPLLWGFTFVLKRVLPYWIDKKIASAL